MSTSQQILKLENDIIKEIVENHRYYSGDHQAHIEYN